ncbi:hypothetical protein OIU78_000720 [Salix suchowensis]|nr:hypothetical protein OIU78_000720 [Salix suchowensis]
MRTCRTLITTSLTSLPKPLKPFSPFSKTLNLTRTPSVSFTPCIQHARPHSSTATQSAVSSEPPCDTSTSNDTVELLLTNRDDVLGLMKMERRITKTHNDTVLGSHWFPYFDRFKCGSVDLSSSEVLQAVGPYMMEERRERIRNTVQNRTYSLCLVVEGLTDFGNVSAVFRSADALGFQSVHVISCDSSKRYRQNRHVSMGAEKWLDIELWDSAKDCFQVLKSRGYRIATTHVGIDAVSIYDMDWSCPTAIVVGNENRGISDEALELSDLHCSIPMKGMVDSFNVSVAAGILMHHAVCDRTSSLVINTDLRLWHRNQGPFFV